MTTTNSHRPIAGTPGDVPDIDALAINTIRTLSMDAVQAANSGHPGTPMALAPVAYTLWQHRLNYDPADPPWGFCIVHPALGDASARLRRRRRPPSIRSNSKSSSIARCFGVSAAAQRVAQAPCSASTESTDFVSTLRGSETAGAGFFLEFPAS